MAVAVAGADAVAVADKSAVLFARLLTGDVPVNPTPDQARNWMIQELAKPEYQAAQPTWFDRLSSAVVDWLQSLNLGSNGIVTGPILLVVALVVIAAIAAAYVIFGPPRRGRRSTLSRALFGGSDDRDAAAMRKAGEAAAARQEWATAIEEMFRSIARRLADRTILSVTPGTTAHDFAARAGVVLPEFSGRLAGAASAFDEVRYLDRDGTEAVYLSTAQLERDLRDAAPSSGSLLRSTEASQ